MFCLCCERSQMRSKVLAVLLVVLFLFLGVVNIPALTLFVQKKLYPTPYTEYVEKYSQQYELDPLLVYSFIRTESSFKPDARSNVDARGLMQITEMTFDWIKPRVEADESVVFEDLYDAETCIQFGSYYLSRCLSRYQNDIATAAAAYHSGWGTVDRLLTNEAYSKDGKTLDVFPYTQMNHYVAKISKTYEKYQEIYRPEGES